LGGPRWLHSAPMAPPGPSRKRCRALGAICGAAFAVTAVSPWAEIELPVLALVASTGTSGLCGPLRAPFRRRAVGLREALGSDGGANGKDFYAVLGVQRDATLSEVKSAFRALALRLHPDVAKEEEDEVRFLKVVEAYEVLSDDEARALYDSGGEEALQRRGSRPEPGAAARYWEEFRPAKRAGASRKYAAREADAGAATTVTVGAVVEYPLREHEVSAGRTHGLGIVVGRNAERGDAAQLPPERRSLCEIEPLWRPDGEPAELGITETAGAAGAWMADELEGSAFAPEEELRVLPSTYVKGRGVGFPEHWLINGRLSPGASGPDGFLGEVV